MAYDIHTDVKYGPFDVIELGQLADGNPGKWWNQSLVQVNDCVIRMGVFEEGEFHFHRHEREDELFYVVEGRLLVDLEGRGTVELGPRQGIMVPRGAVHRTRSPGRTVVLMVEAASVVPTGDRSAPP